MTARSSDTADGARTAAYSLAPSLEDIQALALEAIETIPQELRQAVGGIAVQVVDFPDEETLAAMEIDDPFGLLGLYHGVDLTRKSVMDVPEGPDLIFLYRRPLLDYWCESGEDLYVLVRHVLIHEVGHHFGFSDDDMDAIDNEP